MPNELGSKQRPLRVGIIGSGPSGFYAAESLLNREISVQVDMFDRLPVPFGLVRYGVAPDHEKIKNVIKIYEKTASHPHFHFFGNVHVGKVVSVQELKKYYDALLFTCGAESDRKLDVPGEDLLGSHTATEFVAWYNGHPDYKDRKFNLSCESAVVIGQGNVAVDVCRILSKTVDELKTTDIAQHALDTLAESKIKQIHMIGRRGPVQAKFTPVEIREFGKLKTCDPVIDPQDLIISEISQKELDDPNNAQIRKNFEVLKSYAERTDSTKTKKFFMHFLKSPVELKGSGKLQSIVLEKNKLTGGPNNQKAVGTGIMEELPCGILFRSVGYCGIPIEGVPFDERKGVFPNEKGRIKQGEKILSGFYCAGWIKRGPSGVIGTNKPDSVETVENLLADLNSMPPCSIPSTEKLMEIFRQEKISFITFPDWKKIDCAEIENGQKVGKPREKFVRVEEVLDLLSGMR